MTANSARPSIEAKTKVETRNRKHLMDYSHPQLGILENAQTRGLTDEEVARGTKQTQERQAQKLRLRQSGSPEAQAALDETPKQLQEAQAMSPFETQSWTNSCIRIQGRRHWPIFPAVLCASLGGCEEGTCCRRNTSAPGPALPAPKQTRCRPKAQRAE
jgi:hypothetical protein